MPRRDRLGARRVGAHRRVAAGLVERRDATRRRPASRTPSPRRPGSRSPRRATGTRTRSRRGRAPAAARRGRTRAPSRRHPRAPARAQWTGAPATTSSSSGRCARTRACAATSVDRFLRGSSVATARTYGPSRSAFGPSGVYRSSTPGYATAIRSRANGERLGDVRRGELRDREDQVARPRRVRVLAAVHPPGQRRHPLRVVQRREVVDGRRPQPAALRRVHPVREVEDVELPQRAARPSGSRAGSRRFSTCATRRPDDDDALLDGQVRDRFPDTRRARVGRRRRTRRARAVPPAASAVPREHPEQVVADPGPRLAQRRDVDDDAHGAAVSARPARRAGSSPGPRTTRCPRGRSRPRSRRRRRPRAAGRRARRRAPRRAEPPAGAQSRGSSRRDPSGSGTYGPIVTTPCPNGPVGQKVSPVFRIRTSRHELALVLVRPPRAVGGDLRREPGSGAVAERLRRDQDVRLGRPPADAVRELLAHAAEHASDVADLDQLVDLDEPPDIGEARLRRRPPRGTRGRTATRASRTAPSPRSAAARPPSRARAARPRGCRSGRRARASSGSPRASPARRRSGASCRRGSPRRSGRSTAARAPAWRGTRRRGSTFSPIGRSIAATRSRAISTMSSEMSIPVTQ